MLAALELDAVMVAQTLVSRPMIMGVIVGGLAGAPALGALLGVAIELLSLSSLPVGGHLSWSGPVAAGVAALLAGAECSIGVSLAGGVITGALHSGLEAVERRRRSVAGNALSLGARTDTGLGPAMVKTLAAHAAVTFVLAASAVVLISAFDRVCWSRAPECLQIGAQIAAFCAPWIGLSSVTVRGLRRV
ncbi:MAG: hypothetical protein AAB036_03825 [Elusimicrobiota bacterium]